MNKEFKQLKDRVKKQGWMVYKTKNNHIKWVPPDPTKKMIVSSSTPSDYNAIHQLTRDLIKEGFVL